MTEVSHINMSFGGVEKMRTKHLYTKEQALEIQQIVVKVAEIANKHGVNFLPLPLTGGESE